MFKPGFILSSSAHIEAAMFNRSTVIVYQDDEIVDYGGPIEAHTDAAVTINGASYLKAACEFRIR